MRKKLYKAKKNWVIGLAAGTLLLVGGATTASADTNWNSSAAQFSQFGYNSRPTVTWSGIDTSQYPGVTSNDPANIDSAVLDANVNVQTTGEDTGLNQTTPGFSYNVTTNGHSLRNDESVNVDYYFSDGVNYGTNGAEFDSTNSSTIGYAGTFRNSVEANYLGVSGSINDHQITMRHENDAQMTHTSDPHNVSYLTKEATVNGNTVTNTIRVNTDSGAVQPGVWGLTIKPYWAVNGDVSVYDTAAPYKNGNAFYYIIRDAQGRPRWLEVIRPQNGMKLFSGYDINYTTGPLGGYQMSGNSSTAPGSARNLYMMAPAGLNAEFTYTESYYWVGDGYNNPQANVNAGYLDGYQLEQDDNGNPLLHVAGWHAASTSADLQNGWLIVFDNTTGTEIKRQRINPVARPDVAAQYRNVANSSQSGFNERISLPSGVLGHQLTIIARYSDDANGGEGHHTDLWLGQRININMDNNVNPLMGLS